MYRKIATLLCASVLIAFAACYSFAEGSMGPGMGPGMGPNTGSSMGSSTNPAPSDKNKGNYSPSQKYGEHHDKWRQKHEKWRHERHDHGSDAKQPMNMQPH